MPYDYPWCDGEKEGAGLKIFDSSRDSNEVNGVRPPGLQMQIANGEVHRSPSSLVATSLANTCPSGLPVPTACATSDFREDILEVLVAEVGRNTSSRRQEGF
jgi:hypothetical protein